MFPGGEFKIAALKIAKLLKSPFSLERLGIFEILCEVLVGP